MGTRLKAVRIIGILAIFMMATGGTLLPGRAAAEAVGAIKDRLVIERCAACHAQDAQGRLDRISSQRKTPEGWYLTVFRMARLYGVTLTDEERSRVVKTLSDELGLAPAEEAPAAYHLERYRHLRTGTEFEIFGISGNAKADIQGACTRCHSLAFVAEQRRTEDQWKILRTWHEAIWPMLMLTMRSVDWDETAARALHFLAGQYPFETPESNEWREKKGLELSGRWEIIGHHPTRGDLKGSVEFTKTADGWYRESGRATYTDGKAIRWTGKVAVYNKGTVRSDLDLDGKKWKGVYRLFPTPNGDALKGATYMRDDIGIRFEAAYFRPGAAPPPARSYGMKVPAGKNVDYIKVVPDWAVATIGDRNPTPPESVQFEAIGFSSGPDRKPGTADDIELGPVEAEWEIKELAFFHGDDEVAFVGKIDKRTGLFTPALPGANPARKEYRGAAGALGFANAGDVWVHAAYRPKEGAPVEARAYLLAMPPYFNHFVH